MWSRSPCALDGVLSRLKPLVGLLEYLRWQAQPHPIPWAPSRRKPTGNLTSCGSLPPTIYTCTSNGTPLSGEHVS
ncbi:hypothetical protein C4D60_Mb01t10540 [Musa balbisiana]|uniref:Uncharacterized protein n=1 Tax=Musa balbisiana TaxID=52838 RepID=A0A4S8JLK1_MUSBA|nr:hypothetical protein C4D60_Mb01t10540 [Musa balbisiana]